MFHILTWYWSRTFFNIETLCTKIIVMSFAQRQVWLLYLLSLHLKSMISFCFNFFILKLLGQKTQFAASIVKNFRFVDLSAYFLTPTCQEKWVFNWSLLESYLLNLWLFFHLAKNKISKINVWKVINFV